MSTFLRFFMGIGVLSNSALFSRADLLGNSMGSGVQSQWECNLAAKTAATLPAFQRQIAEPNPAAESFALTTLAPKIKEMTSVSELPPVLREYDKSVREHLLRFQAASSFAEFVYANDPSIKDQYAAIPKIIRETAQVNRGNPESLSFCLNCMTKNGWTKTTDGQGQTCYVKGTKELSIEGVGRLLSQAERIDDHVYRVVESTLAPTVHEEVSRVGRFFALTIAANDFNTAPIVNFKVQSMLSHVSWAPTMALAAENRSSFSSQNSDIAFTLIQPGDELAVKLVAQNQAVIASKNPISTQTNKLAEVVSAD